MTSALRPRAALYPAPLSGPNARMTLQPQAAVPAAANSNGAADFTALLAAVGRDRDRAAFVQLFEHFAPRLKSFLMKGGMGAAQADDLAQDTMLTVWRKAPSYDPKKAAASTWIFTIARNRRIDILRREKRPEPQIETIENIKPDTNPGPEAQASHGEDAKAIAAALTQLPPEQADLIRKAYFEDMTHNDIAAATKLPLGTVKSRLRLGMERLRQSIGEAHR